MQVAFDADFVQSIDGQKVSVLLTPLIPAEQMTGSIQEDGTNVDWAITDAGNTNKCSLNFEWADGVDRKLDVTLLDNKGKEIQSFKSSTQDPAVFDCTRLAGSRAELRKSKMFGHDVLATLPLSRLNGHNVSINLSPASTGIFTQ